MTDGKYFAAAHSGFGPVVLDVLGDGAISVPVPTVAPPPIDHATMVATLVKAPEAIAPTLDPSKIDLIHAILGISGEAGELLDAVKKHAIYNKPLDMVNVVEELGDMEFYMEQLRQRLGITREKTLDANIEKLGKRYRDFTYSNKAASDRADKA